MWKLAVLGHLVSNFRRGSKLIQEVSQISGDFFNLAGDFSIGFGQLAMHTKYNSKNSDRAFYFLALRKHRDALINPILCFDHFIRQKYSLLQLYGIEYR